MRERTSYLNGIRTLLPGILLLAGWLSVQLWQAEQREQALFRLSVSVPSGTISGEMMDQMDRLLGLQRRWAFFCADVEIRIDKYHAAAELWGVDQEYPLTVIKSAGEKQAASGPLLIIGEDFFDGLSDEYGNPISERQADLLEEQVSTLAVRISVQGAGDMGGNSAQDEGDGNRAQDAGILGIVREDGVYMDAEQMRRWLARMGLQCDIRHAELEIRGEQNARKAQKLLEEAGFSVALEKGARR